MILFAIRRNRPGRQVIFGCLSTGPLPVEQILRYGQQLADALAHAHGRGVVHRDLKSANAVVTPDGQIKVLDFGLAKRLAGEELSEATTMAQHTLTAPGMVVGTLAYMAPDQLCGQPADARSDVWALGIILDEMAAGQRPFQGKTGFELTSAILSQPLAPLPASLPGAFSAVVDRCLEKKPGERYLDAGERTCPSRSIAPVVRNNPNDSDSAVDGRTSVAT